ncbi:GntR family transcriptional regulator [Candidatus Bipolaricaulota bacterium]
MMLVSIDERSRQPIYLQIVRQVKEQILVGELSEGDELPSVRELGESLGISLHTARSAYQVLSEAGLLHVRLGKKARVTIPDRERNRNALSDELAPRIRELIVDGLLQGMNTDELHHILDREIAALSARGATLGIQTCGEEDT